MFLHLLESYLQAGVNCKHLHELKERELFIIFRTAYTKSEIIQLLYPIMGIEIDFKAAVLKHKDRVRSKQELAKPFNPGFRNKKTRKYYPDSITISSL